MAFEARVLLKRPRHELPVDIGVKQVEQRPIGFGKTTFTHEGTGRCVSVQSAISTTSWLPTARRRCRSPRAKFC